MSIATITLAIYSNLPSGGAKHVELELFKFLKTKVKLISVTDSDLHPKSFIGYLYTCVFTLPKIHKMLASQISQCEKLVAHHTWLTKSPHVFRYFKGKKIYICQEVPREFYDIDHIQSQGIKDKIINFFRLPIRAIDYENIHNREVTVVVNSKFSKKLVDKTYDINSNVIYPGINIGEFKSSKMISKLNQIISVGAINKLKGYDFIIRAISKIDKIDRPKFIIVGNGADDSYLVELHSLANSLDVEIEIRICISKQDLIKEYLRSKIFVYSPISEPFGIVILEAMASGLPIIASLGGGGYSEILSSKNGILIQSKSENVWGRNINYLLNNHKKQESYSKYNLKFVKKFSNKTMNEHLWRFIQNL